jgi:hypothetical protein
VAIDGTVQFSSSRRMEEDWRWIYPESRWEGSGSDTWSTVGFTALDLRGPWFMYTKSAGSRTATDGPGQWTIQSSFELGTNRDGVLSTGQLDPDPGSLVWALDRQGNVVFSLKLAETSTRLNRLNGQDLGTLTGLTGQIPAIGIR